MDKITQYLQLAARRPELFQPSHEIPLCMDEKTLRDFSRACGVPVGVVYDNSPYYLVVADLCVRRDGTFYTYSRVIYPHRESNGVVVIPWREGRFGLLSIFRHPPRMESGGEFPRGFAEDLPPVENAAKELWEELGVRVSSRELELLGEIQPDTGLSAGKIQVFCARVGQTDIPVENGEGIHGVRWVTPLEMAGEIADGTITDGITLAAYLKYLCRYGNSDLWAEISPPGAQENRPVPQGDAELSKAVPDVQQMELS